MATRYQRKTIKDYIDSQTQYDASTVRISRNGDVTAVLDANKTSNAPHKMRLLVGYDTVILRWAQLGG